MVPWLYDETSRTWVSYDDPQSVAAKVRYVRDHKLGGVVIWELGGDDGALDVARIIAKFFPCCVGSSKAISALVMVNDNNFF